MRKLLIFLTSFSEEDLYFLASSSGVYQLVLQNQEKVFLQLGRSLTCSWAATYCRAVQPYSKPSKLQIKMGEEDDSVKDMFIVLYKRQQPHKAKISYNKNNTFYLKKGALLYFKQQILQVCIILELKVLLLLVLLF